MGKAGTTARTPEQNCSSWARRNFRVLCSCSGGTPFCGLLGQVATAADDQRSGLFKSRMPVRRKGASRREMASVRSVPPVWSRPRCSARAGLVVLVGAALAIGPGQIGGPPRRGRPGGRTAQLGRGSFPFDRVSPERKPCPPRTDRSGWGQPPYTGGLPAGGRLRRRPPQQGRRGGPPRRRRRRSLPLPGRRHRGASGGRDFYLYRLANCRSTSRHRTSRPTPPSP